MGTDRAAGRRIGPGGPRGAPPPDIRHHLPDAGKSTMTEALALRTHDQRGRRHRMAKGRAQVDGVGLDGDGEGTRHLRQLHRAAVQLLPFGFARGTAGDPDATFVINLVDTPATPTSPRTPTGTDVPSTRR